MIDSRDIKELHPCLQRGAHELIQRMEAKGYKVWWIALAYTVRV